jgi:hypothetical protein
MPAYVPEIAHSDSGVHSLDSLSTSSGNNPVPSYAEQGLQSERAAEARAAAEREADEAVEQAKEFSKRTEAELSRLEKESGKKFDEFTQEAKNNYEAWKKSAARDYEKLKREAKKDGKYVEGEAKKAGQWADENKSNPVVVGNAVVITAVAGVLGVGAYRMHQVGQLTLKVAGAWAGVVGLFAVGDYYISQYVPSPPCLAIMLILICSQMALPEVPNKELGGDGQCRMIGFLGIQYDTNSTPFTTHIKTTVRCMQVAGANGSMSNSTSLALALKCQIFGLV